jgi:hypothetical protein
MYMIMDYYPDGTLWNYSAEVNHTAGGVRVVLAVVLGIG